MPPPPPPPPPPPGGGGGGARGRASSHSGAAPSGRAELAELAGALEGWGGPPGAAGRALAALGRAVRGAGAAGPALELALHRLVHAVDRHEAAQPPGGPAGRASARRAGELFAGVRALARALDSEAGRGARGDPAQPPVALDACADALTAVLGRLGALEAPVAAATVVAAGFVCVDDAAGARHRHGAALGRLYGALVGYAERFAGHPGVPPGHRFWAVAGAALGRCFAEGVAEATPALAGLALPWYLRHGLALGPRLAEGDAGDAWAPGAGPSGGFVPSAAEAAAFALWTVAHMPAALCPGYLQRLQVACRGFHAAFARHVGAGHAGKDPAPLRAFAAETYAAVVLQLRAALGRMEAEGAGDLDAACAGALDVLAHLEFCRVPDFAAAVDVLERCFARAAGSPRAAALVLHHLPAPGNLRFEPHVARARLVFYLRVLPVVAARAPPSEAARRVEPVLLACRAQGHRDLAAAADACAAARAAGGAAGEADAFVGRYLRAALAGFPDRTALGGLAGVIGGYIHREDTRAATVADFYAELVGRARALSAGGREKPAADLGRLAFECLGFVDLRHLHLLLEELGRFFAALGGGARARHLRALFAWNSLHDDYVRKPIILRWYQGLVARL